MPTWALLATAILCWGFWGLTEKLAVRSMSPMMVQLCTTYVFSAVAPVMYLFMKARQIEVAWTAPGIAWTAITTILAIAANLAFLAALERADVHRVVGYTSFYPTVTFIACALFLREDVTPLKFLGIMLVSAGTVLATR